MIHNNKVYANADEKFVKVTILYAGQDNVLHYDKELTIPVLKTEIAELFYSGMVVNSASAMGTCRPDFFDEFSGRVTYNNTHFDATDPTEE